MSSICTDVFTVCVTVNINCTLQIPEAHRKKTITGYGTHIITVPFTYSIGTDPDPSHPNFGFSIEPTAPTGQYPIGVIMD